MEIDEAEKNTLPTSILHNFDDYKLFKNFLKNDLKLEVIRHAKFVLLKEYASQELDETINDPSQAYEKDLIEFIK